MSSPLTPEVLSSLKALAEKATAGPWTVEAIGDGLVNRFVDGPGGETVAKVYEPKDRDYLAALSPEVVLALAEAAEERDRLRVYSMAVQEERLAAAVMCNDARTERDQARADLEHEKLAHSVTLAIANQRDAAHERADEAEIEAGRLRAELAKREAQDVMHERTAEAVWQLIDVEALRAEGFEDVAEAIERAARG